MFSENPSIAGPQRAGATHDQVDFDACLRRRVQRADHGFLDQRVHLRDDPRRLAFARIARLAPYRKSSAIVHREWREQQVLQPLGLGKARDVQEHFVDVGADLPVGRQKPEVRVQSRAVRG